MRRAIPLGLLAVLALGGSAMGQSPAASPIAPPAASAPVASPAASAPVASPGAGPAFTIDARHRETCAEGTTCSWYLTLLDADVPGAALTIQLIPGPGSRLVPAAPAPATLTPGRYLVEASQWQIPPADKQGPSGVSERMLSCATELEVAGQLEVSIDVRFRRKDCIFVVGETDT